MKNKVNRTFMMKKKHLFMGLLALVMSVLTGCKDNSVDCKFHTETLDLTVVSKDWEFDDKAMQFYYHFDLPEITGSIYDYGNWTICREFDKGNKNAYQVALPMSIFMTDTLNTGEVAYYTQHIDYRLGIGYVEVQLTNSDYLYIYDEKGKLVKPEDMFFRLQLIY